MKPNYQSLVTVNGSIQLRATPSPLLSIIQSHLISSGLCNSVNFNKLQGWYRMIWCRGTSSVDELDLTTPTSKPKIFQDDSLSPRLEKIKKS